MERRLTTQNITLRATLAPGHMAGLISRPLPQAPPWTPRRGPISCPLGAEANGTTLDYPEQYPESHFGAWPHGRADFPPFAAGNALDPQAGADLLLLAPAAPSSPRTMERRLTTQNITLRATLAPGYMAGLISRPLPPAPPWTPRRGPISCFLGAEANGTTLDYPEQYPEGHFGAWPHGRADFPPLGASAALDSQAGPISCLVAPASSPRAMERPSTTQNNTLKATLAPGHMAGLISCSCGVGAALDPQAGADFLRFGAGGALGAEANGATLDYREHYPEGHFGAWPHGRADFPPMWRRRRHVPHGGGALKSQAGAESNGTTLDDQKQYPDQNSSTWQNDLLYMACILGYIGICYAEGRACMYPFLLYRCTCG
jgi:hypothetical protein